MTTLRRIVLVRHGETEGESSIRYHGSNDVGLSEEGAAHMRASAHLLASEVFETVVSSPLRRAWQAAGELVGDAPIVLEADFREVDFGDWEGLTAEEIEARDPVLFKDWRAGVRPFEYPGGEKQSEFESRVVRGVGRLEERGIQFALVVAHKGVIRTIAKHLAGSPLEDGQPPLGGVVALSRNGRDEWYLGRTGAG